MATSDGPPTMTADEWADCMRRESDAAMVTLTPLDVARLIADAERTAADRLADRVVELERENLGLRIALAMHDPAFESRLRAAL